MIDLLILGVVLGLAAGGAGAFVRALPWPRAWLRRKPLACPLCMSGWASIASIWLASAGLSLVPWPAGWTGRVALALGLFAGATGIGALVINKLFPPPLDLPRDDEEV